MESPEGCQSLCRHGLSLAGKVRGRKGRIVPFPFTSGDSDPWVPLPEWSISWIKLNRKYDWSPELSRETPRPPSRDVESFSGLGNWRKTLSGCLEELKTSEPTNVCVSLDAMNFLSLVKGDSQMGCPGSAGMCCVPPAPLVNPPSSWAKAPSEQFHSKRNSLPCVLRWRTWMFLEALRLLTLDQSQKPTLWTTSDRKAYASKVGLLGSLVASKYVFLNIIFTSKLLTNRKNKQKGKTNCHP